MHVGAREEMSVSVTFIIIYLTQRLFRIRWNAKRRFALVSGPAWAKRLKAFWSLFSHATDHLTLSFAHADIYAFWYCPFGGVGRGGG